MNDRQLLGIARGIRRGILGKRPSNDMCAAVCYPLQSYLWASGVEAELIEGDVGEYQHFWLRLPDGRTLDPTADQFGLAPVYLGPLPPNYKMALEATAS